MLRVLRSRDYFLFWSGSFIANLGVWMQQIALGWLVYDLTRRASLLGTVSFCGNAPILFLGLVGGAIADRASRRTIMLGTLGVIAATALTLAVLTASGHIAVWHIIAISMVAGTASALFAPAMQAVIPSLVEPGELLNAISLNSVQFNLARTIGPALAGFAYGTIGPQGCFALNAAGFLVMILMLARVRLPRRPPGAPPPVGRALRDGLGYARRHPVIAPSLVLVAVMSVFGFPYIILLPALARDTLHLDATGLGYLMAAVGQAPSRAGSASRPPATCPARTSQRAAARSPSASRSAAWRSCTRCPRPCSSSSSWVCCRRSRSLRSTPPSRPSCTTACAGGS